MDRLLKTKWYTTSKSRPDSGLKVRVGIPTKEEARQNNTITENIGKYVSKTIVP